MMMMMMIIMMMMMIMMMMIRRRRRMMLMMIMMITWVLRGDIRKQETAPTYVPPHSSYHWTTSCFSSSAKYDHDDHKIIMIIWRGKNDHDDDKTILIIWSWSWKKYVFRSPHPAFCLQSKSWSCLQKYPFDSHFHLIGSSLQKRKNKKYQQFYVCFTAFLVLCELPQSGHKFGFSHELRDLAHLTLLDGPIGFNEIGRPTNPTQSL